VGGLIPFNVPYVPEISKRYILEAIESSHQQGDGPFTARASKLVADLVGGGHVLLTPSCTHALEMASMLANLGPGDEVILPSYTFTSAATAITKFGASPVFVDIEMATKGINVNQVREAITANTKAISWVNYAGVAPDIEALQSLAKEFNLLLIEDNAHGLGGAYKGKPLGSFGDFATQSFHATKNIQCGEGGALIINNPEFIERAEIIREKGTDRSKFIRGVVQKYQWVDQGSSYLMADSLAALLLGQLENFKEIQSSRKNICESYSSLQISEQYERSSNLVSQVAHMFFLQFNTDLGSKEFISKMKDLGVSVATHYEPLHASTFGRKYPSEAGGFPNSKNTAKKLVRIPVWVDLGQKNLEKIIESCVESFQHIQNLEKK
jgi:dTDP-4-amino-4,6-dideoxygalactose transaminase